MIQAGKMSRRLTVQVKSATQDGFGAESITWSDEARVWASIVPLRGKEYTLVQYEQESLMYLVELRYYPGLSPDGHRFVFVDRELTTHILEIDEPPEDVMLKGRKMRVRCRERLREQTP